MTVTVGHRQVRDMVPSMHNLLELPHAELLALLPHGATRPLAIG